MAIGSRPSGIDDDEERDLARASIVKDRDGNKRYHHRLFVVACSDEIQQ